MNIKQFISSLFPSQLSHFPTPMSIPSISNCLTQRAEILHTYLTYILSTKFYLKVMQSTQSTPNGSESQSPWSTNTNQSELRISKCSAEPKCSCPIKSLLTYYKSHVLTPIASIHFPIVEILTSSPFQ